MCAALDVLGLRSYHWNEVLKNKNNDHLQLWLNAVQAKYDGLGVPFEGEDFDRMLWDYDARSPFHLNHRTGISSAIANTNCCTILV